MPQAVRIDSAGVHAASLEDAFVTMIAAMQAVFGADLSTAPQTVQAQLAGLLAVVAVEFGEPFAGLANAVNVATASGPQLDALFSGTGARRRQATYSVADLTLAGTDGTNVPADTRIADTDGTEWATTEAVTIANGTAAVTAQPETPGATSAAAGTITRIVTVIAGLATATNPAAAVPGRNAETDADYRVTGQSRALASSHGPTEAIRAALEDALADKTAVRENRTASPITVQQWRIDPHAVVAVALGGTVGDITRAVETHRGQGTPTMTGITGGTPAADAAFAAITAGTVTWRGTAYGGLDLSAAATGDERAAALTTLLDGTGVTVAFVSGRYVAQFPWQPDTAFGFDDGTTATAFGLDPDSAAAAPGPFVRPRTRELTVTVAGTRDDQFPADGYAQARAALVAVADSYPIGGTPYLNDFLAAVQALRGLQVSAITVQSDSADVNGISPSLDTLWALPAANIDLTAVT